MGEQLKKNGMGEVCDTSGVFFGGGVTWRKQREQVRVGGKMILKWISKQ